MGTFLLLLILFFVVMPLVRGMLALYRARRAARKYFEQFRRNAGNQQQNTGPQPRKARKKINPEDGEFVSFEEIPGKNDSDNKKQTKVTVEQQIVDVEWEDLP